MLHDPVGGSDARGQAARELAKPIYHRDDPTFLERIITDATNAIGDLVGRIVGAASSGVLGLVVVGLLTAAIVALIIRLTGTAPLRDLLSDRDPLERLRNAADEREEAEHLAARGEHAAALRCTTRALVRELEERGVLEPTPGRTPGAIAREVARTTPSAAADTRVVTDAFESVWYGDRPATAALWAGARDAEARVRTQRLVVTP